MPVVVPEEVDRSAGPGRAGFPDRLLGVGQLGGDGGFLMTNGGWDRMMEPCLVRTRMVLIGPGQGVTAGQSP